MADFVDWAVASRPMHGQTVCGDVATVQLSDARCVLAVIDGLGHGPEAARAAALAAEVVEQNPGEPPDALLHLSHRSLTASRGAAATVAVIDRASGTLDWLGVGNVAGVVVRAAENARPRTHGVFLRGGVLGERLPRLHRPEPMPLEDGDCIVIATDGVRGDLAAAARSDLDVDVLAQRILDEYGIPEDDALVFVGRYRDAGDAGSGRTGAGRRSEARS
ncbi:MAG TPA: SpoIIE family protein phosphatase [Acidimicrobiales bacterium]